MTREQGSTPRIALDDLTAIKGIGPLTQTWLRATFNVRTYVDLAALSVEAIEDRLKADGKITARSRIEDWLAQARELGAHPFEPETLADGGWKGMATFVVIYEARQIDGETQLHTKAHHMEADQTQTWPGVVGADLAQWIVAQLGVPEDRQPAQTPDLAAPIPIPLPDYSDRLKRYADKARQLSKRDQPVPEPILAELLPRRERPEPAPPGEPGLLHSGTLELYIAKARRLADKQ